MGLDTYAYHGEEPMAPSLFNHRLIGGMFSGNMNSFRGKCYDPYVFRATGISLYTEEIPNSKVRHMAEDLKEAHKGLLYVNYITEEESMDLVKFFDTVSKNNGYLVNWW